MRQTSIAWGESCASRSDATGTTNRCSPPPSIAIRSPASRRNNERFSRRGTGPSYNERMLRWLPMCAVASLAAFGTPITDAPAPSMNAIAEQYVKLVLAVGQHDADYVDAFYGTPQ